MRVMYRYTTEYEALKNRYFDWLETTTQPLNLNQYADMYEGIILR